MLDVALLLVGGAVVVLTIYDVASTTISLSSVRGPLSSRLSELVWAIGRRTIGTRFAVIRRGSGPLLMLLVLVGWLIALTAGWTLIFSVGGALETAAEPDQQSSPVRWIDSAFFVFGSLDLHLLPMVGELTLLAQRHLAFPVIHYFNSAAPRAAVAPRIAALDDALLLIEAAELDEAGAGTELDRSTTEPLRHAISNYLSTLEVAFITAADRPPPPPSCDRLAVAGLGGPDLADRVVKLCEELAPRRALLLGYVEHSGSTWDEVEREDDAMVADPRSG